MTPRVIHPRRLVHRCLFVLLIGWSVYASVLTTGHFLSLVSRHRAESAWLLLAALAAGVVLSGRLVSPASSGEVPASDKPHLVWLVPSFALLALALYGGSLSLGLLSDDFWLLDRATELEFVVPSWHLRPLPLVVWAFLWRAADGTPAALHAANIFLHGVNAALVVALARRMGLSARASIGAGAFFACFPGSVEAVAWASGMQDVLVTTFCLAFVLAVGTPRVPAERRRLIVASSLVALLAALASKETAVVAPALACVAWYGSRDRWNGQPIVWGLVLVLAYSIVRISAFTMDEAFCAAPSAHLSKNLVSSVFSGLAVPFAGQELAHFPAVGVLTGWLFAGLVVVGAWEAGSDRAAATRFGRSAAWVVLAALPVWSAFYISPDLQGSRYLYLPACGWSMMVAALLLQRRSTTGRRIGVALAAVLLVVWGLALRSHLRDWRAAAEVRDRVLRSAIAVLHDTPCPVVRFTEVPDSVGGAYVFRNGFVEAVEGRRTGGATPTLTGSVPAGCTVKWRDGGFR